MSVRPSNAALAGVILAVSIAAFLWAAISQDGASRFGQYHDDTLYWNVAGSIARGDGAVVASLPSAPALTKHPPLYPYLLSTFWTPLSESRSGISIAISLSVAFAVWALIAAFLYFRRWKGVNETMAAASVGMCALSGMLVVMSGAVLSDTLFFALAITTFLCADSEHKYASIAAALFGGLAILTRSIGIAVIAAVAWQYLLDRRFRRALGFLALTAPFVAAGVLFKLLDSAAPQSALPGYAQTWLYYEDYVGFWRISVPDLETFIGMLKMNLTETLITPASLTLGPAPIGPVGMSIWVTVTVAATVGLWRRIQLDRVRSYHWALLFHLPFTMLWNFEIADRLLLAFIPLFWLGLWTELLHAGGGFLQGLRASRPLADRVVSVVILLFLASGAAWWGSRAVSSFADKGVEGEDFAVRYAALVDWLRDNTSHDDRFVAIDDGFLYGYTGRQGMWPLAVATDLRYRYSEARLAEQLDMMPDVAQGIDARYLIWTPEDYVFAPPVQQRWEEWAKGFCEVANSRQGAVLVYDLHCRQDETVESSAAVVIANEER